MNEDNASSTSEERSNADVADARGSAEVRVRRHILCACAMAPLVVLTIAATALTIRRAIHSAEGGRDLQWSPTRLFVHGVNPYEAALDGSHDIILTQAPNYLHTLYILYSPLGFLSFESAKIVWVLVNLALAIGIVYTIGRMAGWNWWTILLVGCVFLISTPTRFALINGQTSLLLLAAALIACRFRERNWSGVALAVVVAKYSFMPIALCFVVQRRWKSTAVAIATSLLAWLIFVVVVHPADVLRTAKEPLEVSRAAVADGVGDLMSVIQLTLRLDGSNFALYWVGLIAALLLTILVVPRLEPDQWMRVLAVSSVISLLCFKHLLHDFVFLLPILAIVTTVSNVKKTVVICAVFMLWFGMGILDQLGISTTTAIATGFSFLSLCAILWAIVPTRGADIRGRTRPVISRLPR